jgi:hypothetical protein
MESIGYIINRNFILIAVDTNYETAFQGISLTMNRAKKVHKLNDHNAISTIGNPYKITDINKYVLKLNELGQTYNFEKIIEDLNDVFGSSRTDISKGLRELADLLPKFYNEDGYVKTKELFEFLKDKPEYISLLKDTISTVNNSHPGLTQIIVFSWDKENLRTRLGHFVSIGQNLKGSELTDMLPNVVYTRFSSATIKPEETTKIEQELSQHMITLVQGEWDTDLKLTNRVIAKGKDVLIEGLKKINPYMTEPNVVFYELSQRTNFMFTEPSVDLKKIEYNRLNND